MSRPAQQLTAPLLAALLASTPIGAAAQGTWMQTQCLVGTGAAGSCKASPAWGQTGVAHVQALAAAAGPGNLGLSLAKPETLPAGNAARAQLAAVMLAYLDGDRTATTYRWFGPVAPVTTFVLTARSNVDAGGSLPASTPTAGLPAGAPPRPVTSVQAAWLNGALGDEPQARSASWWLANPYLGSTPSTQGDAPVAADGVAAAAAAADPYRVLRFLAAQCPQLEGKVAPNAWTRCTTRGVPEPASWALAALALLLAAAARRLSGRR